MRLSLKSDLSTVAELSYWEILKLLLGRELSIGKPPCPVHVRVQRAYEAFNLDSTPQAPVRK